MALNDVHGDDVLPKKKKKKKGLLGIIFINHFLINCKVVDPKVQFLKNYYYFYYYLQ
jgi:hypothetical protein